MKPLAVILQVTSTLLVAVLAFVVGFLFFWRNEGEYANAA